RARNALRENAKPQRRLAETAFESISGFLLNRNALACSRDQFARSKMKLATREPVGLTAAMGKPSSKRRAAPARHDAGDDESARGRLLNAATYLFCKNGINATGIDAIIDEAGTAKTTLYKLFGSKNNLVHAVLETEGRQWREWFIGAI